MNDNTELMQSILKELQTLNQNFSDYRVYIEDRNVQSDEKIAHEEQLQLEEQQKLEEQKQLEEQQKADAEKANAEKAIAEQAEVDPYLEKLTTINDTLTTFETKSTSYMDKSSASMENIEYNGNYTFAVNCIILGVLALLTGIIFGKIFFRKL